MLQGLVSGPDYKGKKGALILFINERLVGLLASQARPGGRVCRHLPPHIQPLHVPGALACVTAATWCHAVTHSVAIPCMRSCLATSSPGSPGVAVQSLVTAEACSVTRCTTERPAVIRQPGAYKAHGPGESSMQGLVRAGAYSAWHSRQMKACTTLSCPSEGLEDNQLPSSHVDKNLSAGACSVQCRMLANALSMWLRRDMRRVAGHCCPTAMWAYTRPVDNLDAGPSLCWPYS